ncbi:hypothetical protein [Terrimonas pollutisoli]|uniref:hypothetical protein n=1 Tax=Terrimonas pollutisoli TaxID=3034147 RepID=UPI0023EBA1E7|nr:hypothetical protein [Terrimonas sp. H1YJ31]
MIITILSASCSDFPCAKASLQFGLVGFSDTEADTIIIKKFAKSNPAILEDSMMIDHIGFKRTNDTLKMVAFPSTALLESTSDYELFFPQTGKLVRVTGIEEEQLYHKRKGLFSTTKEGCENHITAYRLDGEIKTVPEFNLTYFTR